MECFKGSVSLDPLIFNKNNIMESERKMRKFATMTVLVLGIAFCGTLTAQQEKEQSGNAAAAVQDAKQPESPEMEIQQSNASSEESAKPWLIRGIQGKLLMYIPNRVADLFDIFSVSLETGLAIGVTARITYGFGLVGEAGSTGALIKGYNRQYGTALTEGYYAQFLFPMATNLQRPLTYGNVNPFWIEGWNYPFPSNPVFERGNGAFDYWAIEAGATCLAGAKVAVHPVEILDFITGFFLIDISGDDYGTRALQ